MKFKDYKFDTQIHRNIETIGWERPTDIQFKSIKPIQNGEDLLAIAQTGTGKTAAFAIPLIDRLHKKKSNKRSQGIQALVMVPTRELAKQLGEVFNSIAKATKVKAFALFGGVEQERQLVKLQEGLDILITTPGRMFDLINQGALSIEWIDQLVLDEADRMLDLGFIEDIKYVKKMVKHRHQTLFFSATINAEIKKLAYALIRGNAIRIQIAPEDRVSRNVYHSVMMVEMDDKRFMLERIIKDNPESKLIVFVRTKIRVERVKAAMDAFLEGGPGNPHRIET